jgi:hypothetical protein
MIFHSRIFVEVEAFETMMRGIEDCFPSCSMGRPMGTFRFWILGVRSVVDPSALPKNQCYHFPSQ